MKVILLEDVKALGKKGQVVEVSDGYAKNFILKKKLGLEATGANMNDLKLQKARDEKVAQQSVMQPVSTTRRMPRLRSSSSTLQKSRRLCWKKNP